MPRSLFFIVEKAMGFWSLLGFGWLVCSLVNAIFSINNGFIAFISRILLGGALLAFHMQMQTNSLAMGANLYEMAGALQLFSVICLCWTFASLVRRSFKTS